MTAWCPECLARRQIVDRDIITTYTPSGETRQVGVYLDCGHTAALGSETIVGPAPGAAPAEPRPRGQVLALQGVEPW